MMAATMDTGYGEAELASGLTQDANYVADEVGDSVGKDLIPYWPTNNGFLGAQTSTNLETGTLIDRFGGNEASRFFSPAGTPASMRALPPGVESQQLRTFEVLQPIEATAGQVAPAFGQIGLGMQYRTAQPLGELINQGFLKEIAP